MRIHASVRNRAGHHAVLVSTGNQTRRLEIPPKETGSGSAVNGGELLLLALATCYCNDVFREASRRGILVESVDVEAEGEFPVEGLAASSVTYRARVAARASEAVILDLLQHTDRVAEIQNTVREPVPVQLVSTEAVVVE
jgi:organic hydroperoxide reductase OsmC/OhrA